VLCDILPRRGRTVDTGVAGAFAVTAALTGVGAGVQAGVFAVVAAESKAIAVWVMALISRVLLVGLKGLSISAPVRS
jgi:hypothetical protein